MRVNRQPVDTSASGCTSVIRKAKRSGRSLTLRYDVCDVALRKTLGKGASSITDVRELDAVMTNLEEAIDKLGEYGPLEYCESGVSVRADLTWDDPVDVPMPQAPVTSPESPVEWLMEILSDPGTPATPRNSMSPGTCLSSLHTAEVIDPLTSLDDRQWALVFGTQPRKGNIYVAPTDAVRKTPCRFHDHAKAPCVHETSVVFFDGITEIHACAGHAVMLLCITDASAGTTRRAMVMCEVPNCMETSSHRSTRVDRAPTYLCETHANQWVDRCTLFRNTFFA